MAMNAQPIQQVVENLVNQQIGTSTAITALTNQVQSLVEDINTNITATTAQAQTQQNLTVDKNIELVVKRLETFKGEDFLNWRLKFEMTVRSMVPNASGFLTLIEENVRENKVLTNESIAQMGATYVTFSSLPLHLGPAG